MEELRDPRDQFPGVTDIWEARFLVLTDYTIEELDAIGNCNRQMKQLRKWVDMNAQTKEKYDERRRSLD